jgi:hypothetical protein
MRPLVALTTLLVAVGGCALARSGLGPESSAAGAAAPVGGAGGSVGGAGGSSPVGGAGGATGGGAPELCGNGVVDEGEQCDGEELADATCVTLGHPGGVLACQPGSCTYDTSGCERCGDGDIGAGEECDGTEFGSATCQSLGFAGGQMACDPVTCVVVGCQPHYQQDFEGAQMPSEFGSGGSAPWYLWSGNPHGGLQAARSGVIGHNANSELTLTLQYDTAGDLSFWHTENTELCCDFLELWIDGARTGYWSGSPWTQETVNILPGKHTIVWRYYKDSGVAPSQDAVAIDDIAAGNGYLPP